MAGKLRVHELAKQLGVTSKELLAKLGEQGEFVKSASSTVEPPVAKKMKEIYGVSDDTAKANVEAASKRAPTKNPAAKKTAPAKPKPATPTPHAVDNKKTAAAQQSTPEKTVTPAEVKTEAKPAAEKKPAAPTPATAARAVPKPAPRKVANNPFSSAPTPSPRRNSEGGNGGAGRGRGNDSRGGRPGGDRQGGGRGRSNDARSNQSRGSRPNPGAMPTRATPANFPPSGGPGGSGAPGGRGPGGGPRGNRGGSSTRRGGNAGGAFGNKNGSGRGRKSKRQKRSEYEALQAPTVVGGIQLPNGHGATIRLARGASLADFAEKIDADSSALVQALFNLGEMVTATQSVSEETLMLLGDEMDYKVEVVSPEDEDRELLEAFDLSFGDEEGDEENRSQRPPVVSVMGHVDHGKTSLLDSIRNANVGGGEAGGITQNIGAYQVEVDADGAERVVTFLDTPGHEAFTAMRARGAEATDIAVLVVAADDGVMPQTVEAINHAKAAGTPIVVAVNKMDKEGASPDKIRGQLTEYDLIPEEYGGTTQFVDVSAKQGTNIDKLLEAVLLTADAELELVANPDMPAQGVTIESHLDRGRGPVATVLVQRGTLRVGDSIVIGDSYGRVRRMIDEDGNDVKEAAPSQPVQVLGLTSVSGAGDNVMVVEDDRIARQIADRRNTLKRNAQAASARKRVSLTDLDDILKDTDTLNVIIKADNSGSVEALEQALNKIDMGDEVELNIVDRGVGAVTETNVNLAATSDAIILGFNVRAEGKATEVANAEGVEIRYYSVIYRAIEDIEAALKGMLKPIYEEKELGTAEIRALFKASSVGLIAGCMVETGKMRRNANVRLVRDGAVVAENAKIESLRREKDDVTEVSAGYECGMVLSYPDIQVGDVVQAYELVEVPRT